VIQSGRFMCPLAVVTHRKFIWLLRLENDSVVLLSNSGLYVEFDAEWAEAMGPLLAQSVGQAMNHALSSGHTGRMVAVTTVERGVPRTGLRPSDGVWAYCSVVPWDADACPECGEWDLVGSGHTQQAPPFDALGRVEVRG